ncbi:hypothetical protein ACB092_11G215500 [Castanea dentata]
MVNLGDHLRGHQEEKTEDSKVVRKILRSLPESFRAKVIAIGESKDLDEIQIQEPIDSSDEDEVENEVAYLAKNFRKFLIFKMDGKTFEKGKFSNFKKDKKDFKKKDSKESSSSQVVTCYECKGHGHVKKECPTYLDGNYNAFMTIAHTSDDLSTLVEELGEHTEMESMGVGEESDDEDVGARGLQESYNSLLEKSREYARVAKAAIRKMKKAEQDYKSILVRYKETKCEIEALNEELTTAYSRIKFLELEVIQANAKVERVASKKLDEMFAYQKPFFDKSGLRYTRESTSSTNVSKEMKFVKAKEPIVSTPPVEKVKVEKKPHVIAQKVLTKPPNPFVAKPKPKGKSLPKAQKGLQTQHFCHHCGI